MADVTFIMMNRTGKKAEGLLTWPDRDLECEAISGPYGLGALPQGLYKAPRSKLLDKPSGSSYCDSDGSGLRHCWMQVLVPQFSTSRTDLGVHPDGGTVGTEGCIGLVAPDTKEWYEAFSKVVGSTTVEVRDGHELGQDFSVEGNTGHTADHAFSAEYSFFAEIEEV